jgi:hypothetical protein
MLSKPPSVNESQVACELGVETKERKPESKANSFHKMTPAFTLLNKQPASQPSNSIAVQGQQMTFIPNRIKILLRSNILEEVNLSGNNFGKIPYELTLCLALKNLDMSKNQIADLSPVLKEFKNLHRLNLAHNVVKCIASQDIPYLFNLKTLILSYNEISLVTEAIENLSTLRALYLDGNPFMSLPTSLRNCRNLKELKLDWGIYIQPPCSVKITCSEVLEKIHENNPASERILTIQELRAFMKATSEGKRGFTFLDFSETFGSVRDQPLDRMFEKSLHLNHQGISLSFLSSPQTLKELSKSKDLLQMAADKNRKTVVQHLLSIGTKVQTIYNAKGESLYHFAINSWAPKIIEYLNDRDLDCRMADGLGNTPLHKLMMKKDRYSYYPVAKGHGSNGKGEKNKEVMQWTELRESKEAGSAKVRRFGMAKGEDSRQLPMLQKPEFGQARVEFITEVIKVFMKLVKTGFDPNQYNNEGVCCWHSVLIHDDYYLFSILRSREVPEFSVIDWTLDRLSPSESILHLAAKCTKQRFFIDLICGPEKLDMLKLDDELHLAGWHLREEGHYTSHKLYTKAFKTQLRENFKKKIQRADWTNSALYKRWQGSKNGTEVSINRSPRPMSHDKIKSINCDSIRRLQGSVASHEQEHSVNEVLPHKEDRKPGKIYVSTPKSNYLRLKSEASDRSSLAEKMDKNLIKADVEELKKRPSGLYLDDVIKDMRRKRQPRLSSDLQVGATPSRLFIKKPISSQRPKINLAEEKADESENHLLDSDLRPDFIRVDLRSPGPMPKSLVVTCCPLMRGVRQEPQSEKEFLKKLVKSTSGYLEPQFHCFQG